MSPQATKAALVTAYYLLSGSNRAAASFAELGAVLIVVELLLDADKRTSEKALTVLDGVLFRHRPRVRACGRAHALVVPVLVKKMLRMSDMATWFVVSALWRLCSAADTGAACVLRRGTACGHLREAAPRVHVGCGGVTKDRANELLNGFRGSVECTEMVDFKGLKRPF
ncbi:hypothetical protein ACQJBY_068658 [Aegilops geniculata]